MNKNYRNGLIIVLAIIVMFQIFFINKVNKEENVRVYNNVNRTVINHKSLKDINEELSCLNNKDILSANKINDKWYVKIKIQGNKEELVNEIAKLKNYEISDYSINRNNVENSIVLDICSKENV